VADRTWTSLPTAPADDPQPRLLYPPSTAATLNLAATAAQCARIWRATDPAFAARCLAASERAFKAALRNPQVYAPDTFTGSGGYGDGNLADEFYWAAAELFVTTGSPAYRDAVTHMAQFTAPLSEPGWSNTAALGTITLATVANTLTPNEIAAQRALITAAADRFLAEEKQTGYHIPFAGTAYIWGSNGSLLNRAMILALAERLTGAARYREGAVDVMDYVLGRNPLDQSYVTGFGANPMQNPHHRFWAHSLDPKMPPPPPGVLSGGPNSTSMVDTVSQTMRGKCVGQRCWTDKAMAYTMNEVAINWNAPLFWVSAYLTEPRPAIMPAH
jgi:endoglucanase